MPVMSVLKERRKASFSLSREQKKCCYPPQRQKCPWDLKGLLVSWCWMFLQLPLSLSHVQRRYEILPNHPVSVCPSFAKLYVATDYAEQRRYGPAPSRMHLLPCNGFLSVCNEMWEINHSSMTLISTVLYFNVCMHVCLFLITGQLWS